MSLREPRDQLTLALWHPMGWGKDQQGQVPHLWNHTYPFLHTGYRDLLIISSLIGKAGIFTLFVTKVVSAQQTLDLAQPLEASYAAQTANSSGQNRAWIGGR